MEKNLIGSLLRVYHSEKSRFTASLALAGFVETYRIGQVKGASLVFTERDKQEIAGLLKATEGIDAATTRDASWDTLSRADSLRLAGNEKLTSASVRQDRVAVRALPGRALMLGGKKISLPEGANIDMDWHILSRDNEHRTVLVVENWEAFAQVELATFDLSMAGENPLVMFRGSPVYRQDHTYALLHTLQLPTYAFVDFDPAGLLIAASLPCFVDLVAPRIEDLINALAQSTNYERYRSQLPEAQGALNASTHETIKKHWGLLRTYGTALPQEYFLRGRS